MGSARGSRARSTAISPIARASPRSIAYARSRSRSKTRDPSTTKRCSPTSDEKRLNAPALTVSTRDLVASLLRRVGERAQRGGRLRAPRDLLHPVHEERVLPLREGQRV